MAFDVPGQTLAPAAQQALAQADRIKVGIRPQRIAIGSGEARLRVVSNQWLGDQSHVAGECA
ncbi:MAG: ABC transporter ATP-binding protein, partial [Bradyrhizobium sp.]